MSIQSKKLSFLLVALTIVTGTFATSHSSGAPNERNNLSNQVLLVSDLTVTVTSATSVALSWNAWFGAGDYTVTVKNLTTNQIEKTFTTPFTSANISGLAIGHTYHFSVEKAGYVIAEDVIMQSELS